MKVALPPVLDGELDDECWKQASKLSGFIFSDAYRPATEETTAYLCYDSKNVYVGFYAKDSKPELIRAEQTKRGGGKLNDDLLEITLDTYHSHKDVYYFDVNPIGAQFESIPKGAGSKTEWRGDWQAAAQVVKDGWVAEMAIPFSLFRYPPGATVWGVSVARYLSREKEWANFPDTGSSFNPNLMADWTGLELPLMRREPLLLGYALPVLSESAILAGGLDVKQVTAGGLTGVVTVNPDFQNVEQSVASIDFSYTEKFVSDNRSFFAEGSGFFPSKTYLYTRRIEDINAGVQGFGTVGRWSAGLMTVSAKNGDEDSAVKVNCDFNSYSSLSALGVFQQSRIDNGAFGGTLVLGRPSGRSGRDTLSLGRYRTRWEDGSGNGDYVSASANHLPDKGQLGYSVSYLDVDPDFNPGLGYFPEPDRVGWSGSVFFNERLVNKPVQSYGWSGGAYRYLDHQGGLRYGGVAASASASLSNNTGAGLGFTYEERPPNIDRVGAVSVSWETNDPFRSGAITFRFGRQDGAGYLYSSLEQRLRGSAALYGALSLEHVRLKYPEELQVSTQLILSATYDLDPQRSLGFRWIQGADISNVYLSARKVVRKGTDLYVILGDPNAQRTEKRVTLKLVVPVDVF